jgi:16S rRNA (adenine1518-N6/adenine1519-N6)-dimethyltransferase
MVLMLQKEVAERIIAKPGKMSLLAVSVQFYSKPEIIQIVPKNNFWPEPEVDSAIVKLKVKSPWPCTAQRGRQKSKVNERDFFRLVKIGFSARRKMLKNNLANGCHISHEEAEKRLKKAGCSEKIRAQELSVEDWIKLLGEFC